MYGPEYPKIQTLFKRDSRKTIILDDYTWPEFGYLKDAPWNWHEKIDGTNCRVHWDGSKVTVSGRTDDAVFDRQYVQYILHYFIDRIDILRELFNGDGPEGVDVTIYGEGYGRFDGSKPRYQKDPGFIVFDININSWWLEDRNILDICAHLELNRVPIVGRLSPREITEIMLAQAERNSIPTSEIGRGEQPVEIEGYVGRPLVDLVTRKGDRIITKLKYSDFRRYLRLNPREKS